MTKMKNTKKFSCNFIAKNIPKKSNISAKNIRLFLQKALGIVKISNWNCLREDILGSNGQQTVCAQTTIPFERMETA